MCRAVGAMPCILAYILPDLGVSAVGKWHQPLQEAKQRMAARCSEHWQQSWQLLHLAPSSEWQVVVHCL